MASKNGTREAWLVKAAAKLDALIKEAKFEPKPTHVSVGFPSRNSRPSARQRIGECHSELNSGDGVAHIFITPLISDPVEVLATLLHEQIHAAVGTQCGHKGAFAKAARGVGLEGKLTATVAEKGSPLEKKLKDILADLGDYPHPGLKLSSRSKVQSTRMIKLECGSCGCIVRMTRKWLETTIPVCGCGGEFEVES